MSEPCSAPAALDKGLADAARKLLSASDRLRQDQADLRREQDEVSRLTAAWVEASEAATALKAQCIEAETRQAMAKQTVHAAEDAWLAARAKLLAVLPPE
jgi:hypothetical protein